MRPIDADRLLFMKADLTGQIDEKNPDPNYNLWEKGYQACLENVQQQVNNAHTIDPESLRPQGEWLDAPYVYFGAKRYVCSHCSEADFWHMRFVVVKENYCPNCGAKMKI